MNTTPNTTMSAAAAIEALAAQLAELKAEKDRIAEAIDNTQDALVSLCPLGKTEAGAHTVSISRARRIDPKKATALYPIDEWEDYYDKPVPKISTKKLNAMLTEDQLDEIRVLGSPVVKLS